VDFCVPVRAARAFARPKAGKHSSIIILAGDATGTPMAANHSTPPTSAPIGGMPPQEPFKAGEMTSLPSSMFHALGICTPPSRCSSAFDAARVRARPVWLGTMASDSRAAGRRLSGVAFSVDQDISMSVDAESRARGPRRHNPGNL
jgi:hypothetical protein